MIKALFTGATGMGAQEMVVDNTANNLANVNTTGFKKSLMEFQDLIYVTERTPGTQAAQGLEVPTGLQIGSGVRPAGNSKMFTEGTLQHTSNPLDMAIEGDGFFQITLPDGEIRYTRDGTFHMDSSGNMVTTDGYLLNPKISIPPTATAVNIGVDGTVSVTEPNNQGKVNTIGKITLVRFPNPTGLSSEGGNLYSETASSGARHAAYARPAGRRDVAARLPRRLQR